ncbi:alpha/beta hydrolase [Tautonia plasticadhaerens]|uniref:Abhydrolase family protein n=1 Tax=Tautonia plasticadhaerens TaxID=2527974 RepID=A0A518H4V6_9BACT|nr:alpha/beta hydrolase family protein [Tautonia plasticadhaerens]QDV35870.1 Abhydrolase family protein [Tautonia plasticadhaerens]
MRRHHRLGLPWSLVFFAIAAPGATAQVRVTPESARGGTTSGEPWAVVPETFRDLDLPDWPVPTDLPRWEGQGRAEVRSTLLELLGELPPRPDPGRVEVVSREQHDGYSLERFRFHNGVDMVVPGILLIPDGLTEPAPAIVGLHGHGSSKESICTDEGHGQYVGPMLARKGYVVAAIDAYFNGDRIGKGPGGVNDDKLGQEHSLFKLNLWLGRTLWGMMLRDEQCLIDYLETRPEVDASRIGATGMSMGCTRAWWLAAIDDRVDAIVGVACFTRYAELISHGDLRRHGIYYFVPGLLDHFDTEAIYALVAPRPMLQLSGDEDGGAPLDGIEVLERKLQEVYALHGVPEHFRSVVYSGTGHEYLPEMKDEMVAWFERHLPVEE